MAKLPSPQRDCEAVTKNALANEPIRWQIISPPSRCFCLPSWS